MEHTMLSIESDLHRLECFIDPEQETILKAYLIKDKKPTRESNTTQRVILYLKDLNDMALLVTFVEWYPSNYLQSTAFGSIVVPTLHFQPRSGPLKSFFKKIEEIWNIEAEELIKTTILLQPQNLVKKAPIGGLFILLY